MPLKYAGENPDIKLVTELKENRIVVSVSDNGPVLTVLTRKRIFQKFYRVPTANVHDVKGFGLGLFYVKHL
ncbi:MAG: sensor histidine kinase [Bacteroidales bacterium]